MHYTVEERFLKYVQVDTQADPTSHTSPSTKKQLDLTKLICEELDILGIRYTTNEAGYIYAHLPSNVNRKLPKVFFCAHLDTAPDCSGKDVKPIVHRNYQGEDIILPDDPSIILSPKNHPNLLKKIGHDIVTASGLTLLGSDDKSGVAIIMDALYQLVQNADIPHGDVKALFTTDEEIGRGVALVDLDVLDADFGYTLDAGDLGSFEDENFSANSLKLTIKGVSAHPGYAFGSMENSIKIAGEIIAALPKLTLAPEATQGSEGFIHPNKVDGMLETTTIDFILRDFDTEKLDHYANLIQSIAEDVLSRYPNSSYAIDIKHQYRNMKVVIDQHPHVVELAVKALDKLNIPIKREKIRGGTDGATLSNMGLPCPNLFAGEQAIHSRYEWTSIQDMQKGVDAVLEICKLIAAE